LCNFCHFVYRIKAKKLQKREEMSSPQSAMSAGSVGTNGSGGHGHMMSGGGSHSLQTGNGLAPPPGSVMHQQQGHVTVSHHVQSQQSQGHGIPGVNGS
jgi:hypothetical protein